VKLLGATIRRVARRPFIRQVLLYGVFGVLAAGVDYLAFLELRHLGLPLQVANLISVHIGMAISFTCNAFFNFRRTNALVRRAAVFLAVGWTGLGLSALILHLGVVVWDGPERWVKAGSIFVVAAVQFTLNKLVTFRIAWTAPSPPPSGQSSMHDAVRPPQPEPAVAGWPAEGDLAGLESAPARPPGGDQPTLRKVSRG
jgi:putative flippase GtrA